MALKNNIFRNISSSVYEHF